MNLQLGIDVDNVIYPYSTVMARWTELDRGLPVGALDDIALSWTWYKDQWGLTSTEFMEHFRRGVQAGYIFTEGCPTEGSVSTLHRLVAAGHEVIYVSAREIPGVSEGTAWRKTHEWLRRHGFPQPDRLVISDDKTVAETDVFLDDGPHNVLELKNAGHPYPLLWDRPHNQRVAVPGVTRVHSWSGYERIVTTLADDLVMGRAA